MQGALRQRIQSAPGLMILTNAALRKHVLAFTAALVILCAHALADIVQNASGFEQAHRNPALHLLYTRMAASTQSAPVAQHDNAWCSGTPVKPR